MLEAQNGVTALRLLEGPAAGDVALVLTDLRMPVMDGDLASWLRPLAESAPTPHCFHVWIYAQLMDMRLIAPDLAFLAQPFRNDELMAASDVYLGDTG